MKRSIHLVLPKGKDSTGVCDASIDYVTRLPDPMRGSLTWDQGTKMGGCSRATLGYLTPREAFQKALAASTTWPQGAGHHLA